MVTDDNPFASYAQGEWMTNQQRDDARLGRLHLVFSESAEIDPEVWAKLASYSPVPEISTSSVEPQPEPQPKLHGDMTLADWKRAFANYDRKPWQTD
jgi:hypothetical protein